MGWTFTHQMLTVTLSTSVLILYQKIYNTKTFNKTMMQKLYRNRTYIQANRKLCPKEDNAILLHIDIFFPFV